MITLTKEEAQQVLDALVFATPSEFSPAEVYKDSVVLLQNRLEQPDSKAHLQFSGPMHVVCKCEKCKAQPEPEPVMLMDAPLLLNGQPLYTAPPQRKWQGLTDEEIKKEQHHIDWTNAHTYAKFARAIEAKLKEKNA